MSSYIDLKFINDLRSSRLSHSLKKRLIIYLTLDVHIVVILKNHKTKARAYLYSIKNDMFFKCHNCSQGSKP
jgi:hypothetical protein